MPKTNFKTLTATVSYETYTDLIQKFEINNQDDMDSCIDTFIQNALDDNSLQETLDEYYSDRRNPYRTIKSLLNDLENPAWG